jgi:hypothetical protein
LTAQGHPRAIFNRAIQRQNLVVAEITAREIGSVSLAEALDLVCLVADKAPARLDAYARRWVSRLLDERPLTLAELDVVVSALRALPSERAAAALRAFA